MRPDELSALAAFDLLSHCDVFFKPELHDVWGWHCRTCFNNLLTMRLGAQAEPRIELVYMAGIKVLLSEVE